MREYLFHGKRTDNGEWVEGFCQPVYKQPDKCFIGWYERADQIIPTIRAVDPETVGQYTGMTDISGKKIFEDDIIKTAVTGLTQHTGVVKFSDGAFGLKCTDGGAYFLCFVTGNFAIIGNIHDNPEILKEGGEE